MPDSSRRLEIERLIDRVADEFEAAWRDGKPASIDEYLTEAPDECRRAVFQELLAVELQLRHDRGEEPRPQDYQARFVEYAGEIRAAFALADETGDSQATRPGSARYPKPGEESGKSGPDCQVQIECASDEAEEPYARFGRFQLLEELGSGGFGTVWKARDTVLKRLVALKVPRADRVVSPQDAALMAEARSAARLKHAGIVQVYDAGEVAGTPYIASEYIKGKSLRAHLKMEREPGRRAAQICLRVAEALQHAHEMGLVHRDLKPANILLDEAGIPHVADFGLAKTEESEAPEGELAGTAGYMAPEQAAARTSEIDRRSDVYSLGVILYEMLTGGRPFHGEGDELLNDIQTVQLVRPRRLDQTIARDLEAICLKCLEKTPADRYQAAADLAEDLRKYLHGEPVSVRTVSVPLRLARWARRRPAVAVLLLASTLCLVAAAIVGAASYVHTLRALETARRHLYFHSVIAAGQAWLSNDVVEFDRMLEQCPPGLRGWEWGYLKGLQNSAEFVLRDAGGPLAFSPDGRLIASGGGSESALKLWDAATGAKLAELDAHKSHISSLDFSSDGSRLVTAGREEDSAVVWNVPARRKIGLLRGHTGPVHSVKFLPGTRRPVTASGDRSLRVWDADSQQELFRIDHGAIHPRSLAVSPDGQLIALPPRRHGREVRIWSVQSREEVWEVPAHNRANGLAFSPDGKRLAAAAGHDLIRIWDVAEGEMVQAYPVVPIAAPHVAYNPDGTRIAAVSWDNSIALVRYGGRATAAGVSGPQGPGPGRCLQPRRQSGGSWNQCQSGLRVSLVEPTGNNHIARASRAGRRAGLSAGIEPPGLRRFGWNGPALGRSRQLRASTSRRQASPVHSLAAIPAARQSRRSRRME